MLYQVMTQENRHIQQYLGNMEPSKFNIYGLNVCLDSMIESINKDFFVDIMDKSFTEVLKEDITKGKRKYLLIG